MWWWLAGWLPGWFVVVGNGCVCVKRPNIGKVNINREPKLGIQETKKSRKEGFPLSINNTRSTTSILEAVKRVHSF